MLFINIIHTYINVFCMWPTDTNTKFQVFIKKFSEIFRKHFFFKWNVQLACEKCCGIIFNL